MTEKKIWELDDFPFYKMSAGTLATVERGWSRCATKEIKYKLDKYYIQGTTWKDKKQVRFLHTYKVWPNDGSTTERYMKCQHDCIKINCSPRHPFTRAPRGRKHGQETRGRNAGLTPFLSVYGLFCTVQYCVL